MLNQVVTYMHVYCLLPSILMRILPTLSLSLTKIPRCCCCCCFPLAPYPAKHMKTENSNDKNLRS